MPTPPYAALTVAVNGGAPTSGGVDVPSAATLQFGALSTVGWKQQRYEIYEYPEGFATPAGWTLAADGTIFYATTPTPPLVTLPANTLLWGPWSSRLKINEAIDDNATTVPNLVDESTILQMLSPRGQRMIAALEGTQFCTSTTLQKRWVRTIQRNQRVLEAFLPVVKHLNADFASAASAGVAQNTNLVIPVGPTDEGILEFGGNWRLASGTSGVKLALSAPGSATLQGHIFSFLGSLVLPSSAIITSTALSTAFNTVSATDEAFHGACRIKMDGTTGGNLVLQIAPVAAVVATLRAGAWVRWHPSTPV